jgi:hypothetical protein
LRCAVSDCDSLLRWNEMRAVFPGSEAAVAQKQAFSFAFPPLCEMATERCKTAYLNKLLPLCTSYQKCWG